MILEVKNASFSFFNKDKELNIFEDINFCCDKGDVVSILGKNGCGKTTLLKCIVNLIPFTKGNALLNGKDIAFFSKTKLWQKISYAPQRVSFVPSFTVEQMLLLGYKNNNLFFVPDEKAYNAINNVINLLNLEKIRFSKCCNLSGGELQLVLLARALVCNPEIIILDEPESNLDFYNQLNILEVISFLAKEKGLLCIFNTHFPNHALQFSNKTLIFGNNKKAVFGNSKEIISEKNIELFFDVKAFVGNVFYQNNNYQYVIPFGRS